MGGFMSKKSIDSDYPQDEAEKRRDELLGNLLRTPPQPRPERDRKNLKKARRQKPE
tara:strand:+ start:1343 stop:1510 length:168 start_codon:yes stop_codon:yes gene_type:complete